MLERPVISYFHDYTKDFHYIRPAGGSLGGRWGEDRNPRVSSSSRIIPPGEIVPSNSSRQIDPGETAASSSSRTMILAKFLAPASQEFHQRDENLARYRAGNASPVPTMARGTSISSAPTVGDDVE